MQSNRARLGVLAAAVAVAAVLFIVLGGGDDEDSNGGETTATETQTATGAEKDSGDSSSGEASIVFRNGRPVGGVEEIKADGGDTIFIVVDSDEGGDIHVHDYDVEAPVEAGEKSQVAFTADLEGIFEVELHLDTGEEIQIGELTVNPSE